DHDYDLDLILLGDTAVLLRKEGAAGFADRTADFPFVHAAATDGAKLRLEPDTKAFDLAVWDNDDAPVSYRERLGGRDDAEPYQGERPKVSDGSRGKGRWISVRLEGVKSLKRAQDAEVEVKAGTLYRKQIYAGAPLTFDVGNAATVDVVRITWPNGLIQNE